MTAQGMDRAQSHPDPASWGTRGRRRVTPVGGSKKHRPWQPGATASAHPCEHGVFWEQAAPLQLGGAHGVPQQVYCKAHFIGLNNKVLGMGVLTHSTRAIGKHSCPCCVSKRARIRSPPTSRPLHHTLHHEVFCNIKPVRIG